MLKKPLIVVPAYSRDYKTAETAVADWKDGKDFMISDLSCVNHGMYMSNRDPIKNDGYDGVKIRFNKLRDFVLVDLDGEIKEG